MVNLLRFFCPVLLFGPVCFMFFVNYPPRTFIWTRTFIWNPKVFEITQMFTYLNTVHILEIFKVCTANP